MSEGGPREDGALRLLAQEKSYGEDQIIGLHCNDSSPNTFT